MIDIKLGYASCGIASGAKDVLKEFKKKGLNVKLVGCIGACFAEPIVEIKKDDYETIIYSNVKKDDVEKLLESIEKDKKIKNVFAKRKDGKKSLIEAKYIDELDYYLSQEKRVSSLCGIIDPTDIEDYIKHGGYESLKKAQEIQPKEIIDLILKSELRGRGGAGFLTGKKWNLMGEAKTKYFICNFDEGDPGAFMNRVLVESCPHQLLEGMIIACLALDVKKAYIYTRAEYPLAVERLKIAIRDAKNKGLIGYKSDNGIDVEIRLGAGAYVCGEETALIKSIEGKAGRPTNKPPFPAQVGLFGKPTVINNVETISNIPNIIKKGEKWFKEVGSENNPGTKMFSFSGFTKVGGYIEVPLGITIKELLKIAKVKESEIKGLHIGGPSGGTISLEYMDLKVDYDNVQKAGAIMGSGSMVIIPKDQDMVQLAKFFIEFSKSESCGKCVPCREGNVRLLEIIDKILSGKGELNDLIELEKMAKTIRDSSFCGLGKAAPNPILSTLKYFREDYINHLKKGFILKPDEYYEINKSKCIGCHLCSIECPVGAITGKKMQLHKIDINTCIRCGKCFNVCKVKAIDIKTFPERK
ncbi:MAG: NADH-ubiquinone oxidoreductase-F iron-sulfur binding region domain-containing protein [Candidatus Nanoarchaeia archaeon]|nr:NADH-ubiquinone oxidoreductase-F iron-sulfur binding region domain-containing protein [Candidatus Nanoarchaeia archaeon]